MVAIDWQMVFLNTFCRENLLISIEIPLKHLPDGPVDTQSSLFEVMAQHYKEMVSFHPTRYSSSPMLGDGVISYWLDYALISCSLLRYDKTYTLGYSIFGTGFSPGHSVMQYWLGFKE